MLPSGDEADNMEQSTMAYVFNLFGKGVTQMLTTSVQQQTLIDELRSQVRSLQTQVSNLTASIDEIENRIFVRLQSMQPTIYTREGIPIDDALDTITSKISNQTERLNNYQDTFGKVDAELQQKVDRDEFLQATGESQKNTEQFNDLSLGLQTLQKELQRQRQEAADNNERVMQTIKLQIQQTNLTNQLNATTEEGNDKYVTREELNNALQKLKIMGSSTLTEAEGGEMANSAIVEFALSGEGATEEKVLTAYEMLKKKQEALDSNYETQKQMLAEEFNRLAKIAETNQPEDENDDDFEEDWYSDDENVFEEDVREYRTIAVDWKDGITYEETDVKERKIPGKRRNIGLTADVEKMLQRTLSQEMSIKDTSVEQLDVTGADNNQDDEIIEEEVIPEEKPQSAKSKRSKSKKKKGMKAVIEQMKASAQEKSAPATKTGGGGPVRVDESRITQKVLEAVMPRVENALIDVLSSGKGGGVKLERHEAKQLVEQLSLLDSVNQDIKNLKVKVALKYDKGRAESELKLRVTRDELFQILMQVFPENTLIEQICRSKGSRLPPLKNTPNSKETIKDDNIVQKSRSHSTAKGKGPLTLVPSRNSKMLSLNQKFLRGADGRYYLRDVSAEATGQPANAAPQSIFGSGASEVSAAFDFQPYMPVGGRTSEMAPAAIGQMREQTPVDETY